MSDGASLRKVILVVDDEKNIRFTVVHALQSDRITVESASNGIEGLQMFQGKSYDLLLVDLRMPGMTGLEMLREIRNMAPETPPAVIITAYGVPEQLLEAASLGAIDCIRKPFSIRTIRSLIDDIFERLALPPEPTEPSATYYLRRGKRALMLGDCNNAVPSLQKALELDSLNVEVHILLGICSLLGVSGTQEPVEHFRRALVVDPANTVASEYLAWLSLA